MTYKRGSTSRSFSLAILDGISSVGLLYPEPCSAVRYPGSYGADMDMIGRDMWRAVERHEDGEVDETQEHTNTPSARVGTQGSRQR